MNKFKSFYIVMRKDGKDFLDCSGYSVTDGATYNETCIRRNTSFNDLMNKIGKFDLTKAIHHRKELIDEEPCNMLRLQIEVDWKIEEIKSQKQFDKIIAKALKEEFKNAKSIL